MTDRQPVDNHVLRLGDDEIAFRVTSAESGGALVAFDMTMPSGGGPPGLHRHPSAEVYRVESGELTFHVAEEDGAVRCVTAGPGDVIHIPGGRAHTIRNATASDACAYVVFVPGGEMEAFARAAAAAPPEDVMALAARHGIELVADGAAPAAAGPR